MEVKNKVELKLKDYDKCYLECDMDCPLGTLYDYSCALQSFILERMKQAKEMQDKAIADQKASEQPEQV